MAHRLGDDHCVQMLDEKDEQHTAASPERKLNRFVRTVAAVERTGNALGTLAFTWATVVLFGGYPTNLGTFDFWGMVAIVFLEAARFLSNNRPDYRLFFKTSGAFRSLGWNGAVAILCFSNVLLLLLKFYNGVIPIVPLVITVLLLVIGKFLPPGALKLTYYPLRGVISLWGPLVGILLLGPCLPSKSSIPERRVAIPRITFVLLIVLAFLLTISRLRFPMIIRLERENSSMFRRLLIWRPVVLALCMFTAIVLSVYLSPNRAVMIISLVIVFLVVSFGNLQFPAAVIRLVLAISGLALLNEKDYTAPNLVPSLNIFYGMVLGQGILYIVACILECFSFIPRRSLVRHAGFRGQWGVKSVNMYYTHAFEKCMEASVLAPKNMDLTAFAMDCLNSDTPKMQLYGVKMLHSFLQKEAFKIKTISKLNTCTKTVTTLLSMLGCTTEGDTAIRLFSAKVTAELAGSLRVVAIPGTMQFISSLLDSDHQPKRQNILLEIDSQEEEKEPLTQDVSIDEQNSQILKCWHYMTICWSIPEESSSGWAGQNSCIVRYWQKMTKFWSIPKEGPLTDHDLLPVLGMSILESLANCDNDNCVEISRATGLISKIIGFTSYRSEKTNTTEVQQNVLIGSSLKVLQRLSSTGGEIGMALRQSISEHPFLLSNLAEILDDSGSSKELRKLVADILRNLAMDGDTSHGWQLIISRLMHAFLSQDAPSSVNSDHLIRTLAGQALAMLAVESADNCSAMLKEPGYVFIKELISMIRGVRYKYVAASLLGNLCAHARAELSNSDLRELSHALPEVLEGIMNAEGGELEILIGLSSQICRVIPIEFAKELEHGQIKERFVKRLVDALNANMKPTAHCPGMRRVIIEQAIYMMEYNSHYANCFKDCWMMEALSMVERTATKAEEYRVFLGDFGLMKYGTRMSNIVTRAKQLMAMHST